MDHNGICDLRSNPCLVFCNGWLQSPIKKNSHDPDEAETPQKRRRLNQADTPEASPRKSNRSSSAAAVEASRRKSSRLKGTPQKSVPAVSSPRCVKMNTPEASPRKPRCLQNTPKKTTVAQVSVTPTATGAKKNLKVQLTSPETSSWKATKYQVPKVCIM